VLRGLVVNVKPDDTVPGAFARGAAVVLVATTSERIPLFCHAVTCVPESVRVRRSAASNHTIQSGMSIGRNPRLRGGFLEKGRGVVEGRSD
jgi:hypothetical protein